MTFRCLLIAGLAYAGLAIAYLLARFGRSLRALTTVGNSLC